MEFSIVPAIQSHLDEIAALELQAFGEKQAWTKSMLESELKDVTKHYYCAIDENNRVIGYVGYAQILDEAHIMNVAVAEANKRRGVARRLIDKLLIDAKGRGLLSVTLEVSDKNTAAIALYEKFGFKCFGLRKNYYPDGSGALIYWADL